MRRYRAVELEVPVCGMSWGVELEHDDGVKEIIATAHSEGGAAAIAETMQRRVKGGKDDV